MKNLPPHDKIFSFWINSLKNPEIDKYERAIAIKDYMTAHNLSQRSFAEKFDIPHSTIQDWLLVLRVPQERYVELIKDAVRPTTIYRAIRDNKSLKLETKSAMEIRLMGVIDELNRSSNVKYVSDEIYIILDNLSKAINTFKFRLERKQEKDSQLRRFD